MHYAVHSLYIDGDNEIFFPKYVHRFNPTAPFFGTRGTGGEHGVEETAKHLRLALFFYR
jgi:hypothetical protein